MASLTNLTTSTLVSVDQQLNSLIELFHDVENYLKTYRPAFIPDHVYQAVESTAAGLPSLRKQISALEAEWRNLRSLAQIGSVVNSSLELDRVLQVVMDTIIQITGAERGFLMLRNNESGEMDVRVARNWSHESLEPDELNISQTVVRRVLNSGQPVMTTDAQEDPRFAGQESVVLHNLRSILCVPLHVKQELTGVIYVDNRVRAGIFTRRHLELLIGFSNQAGVAIANAHLYNSIRFTLEEVTELKKLMDNVFSSIPSGVISTTPDGRIRLCNRAATQILGVTPGHLVNLLLSDVLPELQDTAANVTVGGYTVVGFEFTRERPGLLKQHLRASLSPIQDENGHAHGLVIVMEDLTEQRRLEARQSLFSRMVAPAVIDQIELHAMRPGGERREITILFADLRGFTSYSELVQPEELVSVLNRYLSAAADAILQEGGTIDKFLGDAVMAWFNAPLPQADHTLRAVRAALAIRDTVQQLNAGSSHGEYLSFGVGIHVGEAVLGLIGTEKRLDYTAIGDSVNTARRIQENAIGGQILISKAAYERVAHRVKAGQVFPLRAYGKREPVVVVEVAGLR